MIRPYLLSMTSVLLLFACSKKEQAKSTEQENALTASSKFTSSQSRDSEKRSTTSQKKSLSDSPTLSDAEQQKSLAAMAWNTIETDPASAHAAFAQLPAGSKEKIDLIKHYSLRLAEQDLNEALQWAASFTNQVELSAAMSQIALYLAETDPVRSAKILSDTSIAGRDFDVAVVQVMQRWAATAPAETAAWLAKFPAGEVRTAGTKQIAERWLPKDPAGAFAWLKNTTDTQQRVEVAQALESVMLQQRIEKQQEWRKHADPTILQELEQQRQRAIEDVGSNIPSVNH